MHFVRDGAFTFDEAEKKVRRIKLAQLRHHAPTPKWLSTRSSRVSIVLPGMRDRCDHDPVRACPAVPAE
jgi:hypothetical protein